MKSVKNDLEWLSKEGEIETLIRSIDWSKTALGPIETWPQSLRTTVSLCLASNFPINIIWGPEAIQIYNVGYSEVCGKAHPRATGEPYPVTWASAWPVIGGPFEQARKGKTSFLENQRMFLERNGYLEETFFTFSLSPIRDETGDVAGLFHPVNETTASMLSDRRTRVLRDIARLGGRAETVANAGRLIIKTLADARLDLPFVTLYTLDVESNQVKVLGSTGIDSASAAVCDDASLEGIAWPFTQVLATGKRELVNDVVRKFGSIQCGEYPEPTQKACVLPIIASGHDRPIGFVVAGLSTRLPLNESYTGFFEMLGSSISSAISNARAYEEEKRKADELAALDKAKTAFFSNVSHEFRTPLTLMLGPLTDLLQLDSSKIAQTERSRIELIHRNAKRLLKLVNTLLEFSRIEAGRLEAHFQATPLSELTRQLASMFQSEIDRAGLKYLMEISELSESTYVDRTMWEKIVLNLLSNAFKFTHQGHIQLSLKQESDRVVLAVSDTGTGIPPSELPQIFERFHRVESSKGRSYEGTGIGLALIFELVKLHGGSIRVESVLGQGTTFTVEIPRGKSHLNPLQVSAVDEPLSTSTTENSFVLEVLGWSENSKLNSDTISQKSETSSKSKPRVLVADDNADMRRYVQSILEAKYDLTLVSDGRRALNSVLANPPDLILSDVMMPELDGFAFMREVRANPQVSSIPIILLSARAGEESRIEGIEAGADDYLVKPFSSQELLVKMQGLLELGTLRAQYQEDRLYSVFMQTSVGICVSEGPLHIFRLTNPTYVSTLFGGRNLLGKPVREALPELEGQGFFELLDEVYKTGKPMIGTELLVSLKQQDGQMKQFYLDLVYQPKLSLRGEIEGILTVVNDVTERVLAKKKAEKLAEELHRALGIRDEFLAVASHELKTPITSLKLQIQMAMKKLDLKNQIGIPYEKQLSVFGQAVKQVNRLTLLIDDLLDVSRIESGNLECHFETTSLNAVIAEVVSRFESELSQTETEVDSELSTDIVGNWDRFRIEQILSNLLGNALKYAAGKPIQITAVQHNQVAEIGVRDFGPGILPEKQGIIFERFERGHTSSNISGLGLGLYIAREIVRQHKGTIEIKSVYGQGAQFVVKLPLNPLEKEAR